MHLCKFLDDVVFRTFIFSFTNILLYEFLPFYKSVSNA